MDLLFKRYASPFLLLDQYIQYGKLVEIVDTILEQDSEDTIWQYYLSLMPFAEKSYTEFKQDLLHKDEPLTNDKMVTIIENSFEIANNILPKER